MATYGGRVNALIERWKLPDDFDDDAIQKRFERDPGFAAAVARETDLLLQAAAARDDGDARRLAREALASIRARQTRCFPAADGYLAGAEDIWLTMEGSAQWLGAQWLASLRGGGVAPDVARTAFGTRGRWWSQRQGYALFAALTRLTGSGWEKTVFGDGRQTGLEMLGQAAAKP